MDNTFEAVSTTATVSHAVLQKRTQLTAQSETATDSKAFLAVGKRLYGASVTGTKSSGQLATLVTLSGQSRTGTRSRANIHTRTYKNDPKKYRKSESVFVYDRNERLQLILSDDTIPYKDGWIKEELNGDVTVELKVLASNPDVERIENDGRIVTRNIDGDFMEFIIREIEDTDDGSGTIKKIKGEGGEFELIDEWLPSYVEASVTLETALKSIIEGTRWEVGDIEMTNVKKSVELRHMTVRKAVNKLIEQFGVEASYRVETRGNRITRRYIDLHKQRGKDIGKRFEAGKDILSTNRVFDSTEIKTALYGVGASDDEGNRLTFSDIEWKKSSGDPVDKPKGQSWVGDVDAMERWGYEGGRRHKKGGYDGQEEDAAELLLNTWNELQKLIKLRDTYELDVIQLGEILGYPHEKVRLGDRVRAINHNIYPVLESQASVIEYRHNLNDSRLSECTLGHFRAKVNTDERLSEVEEDWSDKRGELEKKPDKVKNELQQEIDDKLEETQQKIDEANDNIDKAKEDLEQLIDDIEVGVDDVDGLKDNLDDLDDAIDGKIPIGMAAEDVNDNNTKLLGKNLVIDGDTTVTGTIGASSAIFKDMGTENMTAVDAIIQSAVITGDIKGPDAIFKNITTENMTAIDADIQDATITGTLDGVDGNFVGTIYAEEIKGNEISGVTFETGTKNDKRIHMEEQTITLWDGNKDKLYLGFRDSGGTISEKPYMIWGHGKSDGTSVMTMEKGEEHFYMDYLTSDGLSWLRFNYNGSVSLQSRNVLNLQSEQSIEANTNIYAPDFKTTSDRNKKSDIKEYDGNALETIGNTKVYSYVLEDENNTKLRSASKPETKIGMMADECDAIGDGESVSLYNAVALSWKAIQEIKERLDDE